MDTVESGLPSIGASPQPAGAPWVPLESVAAVDLDYERFLRDYVHRNRPVVVTGAVTRWPALHRWTPGYFKERFAQHPVAVSYQATMPFDQFIDAVMASDAEHPGPYMFRLFLHEHLPELLEDLIPQNAYSFPRRYASPLMRRQWRRPDGYLKLLIGGLGSSFPVLHYDGDNAHAAITEIYGDKEFIMYAPEDGAYLYPNPKMPNKSLVGDIDRPDLERFPLLPRATRLGAYLGPGDMVFVPSRWWHTARPLNPSVSVCVNMLDGSNWAGFVDETCASVLASSTSKAKARTKAGLYRAYLTALGSFLRSMEVLQERAPSLARALVLPAWLAPASAAQAPEPGERPLTGLVSTP